LVAFVIGAWLLLRVRPGELQAYGSSTVRPRAWLAATLPLGLIAGLNLANQQTGIVVIGSMGQPEEVALLRVALQGASLVAIGLQAANVVVAPHFARLHAKGDYERMQQLATQGARLVSLLTIPVFVFLLAF